MTLGAIYAGPRERAGLRRRAGALGRGSEARGAAGGAGRRRLPRALRGLSRRGRRPVGAARRPPARSSTSRSATATPRSCAASGSRRHPRSLHAAGGAAADARQPRVRRLRRGLRDRGALGRGGRLRHPVRRRLHARHLRSARAPGSATGWSSSSPTSPTSGAWRPSCAASPTSWRTTCASRSSGIAHAGLACWSDAPPSRRPDDVLRLLRESTERARELIDGVLVYARAGELRPSASTSAR